MLYENMPYKCKLVKLFYIQKHSHFLHNHSQLVRKHLLHCCYSLPAARPELVFHQGAGRSIMSLTPVATAHQEDAKPRGVSNLPPPLSQKPLVFDTWDDQPPLQMTLKRDGCDLSGTLGFSKKLSNVSQTAMPEPEMLQKSFFNFN